MENELVLAGPPQPNEIATGRWPIETLDEDDDNGTMPDNVATLAEAVVGRRIARAFKARTTNQWSRSRDDLILELDNGTQVRLQDTDDCCAYTQLEGFLLHPESVDHVITGVGTENGYTRWHIFADFGDVMALEVGWSAGNSFYYGYGFDIRVEPVIIDGEVVEQRWLPAAPLALED